MFSRRHFVFGALSAPAGFHFQARIREDADALEDQARAGLAKRLGVDPPAAYFARLSRECREISRLGLGSQFRLASRTIDILRMEGVLIGPRQGSLSGCLVAFALGISALDPVRFDLLGDVFLGSPYWSLDVEDREDIVRILEAGALETRVVNAAGILVRNAGGGEDAPSIELLLQPLLGILGQVERERRLALGSLDPDDPVALRAYVEASRPFTFEDPRRRRFLRAIAPSSFGRLIEAACLASWPRTRTEFFARRHGIHPAMASHPALAPFLVETEGMLLFDDQERRIARSLAGIPIGHRRPAAFRREQSRRWKEMFVNGSRRRAGLASADAMLILGEFERAPRAKRACLAGLMLFGLWMAESRRELGGELDEAQAYPWRGRCRCVDALPVPLALAGGEMMCIRCHFTFRNERGSRLRADLRH